VLLPLEVKEAKVENKKKEEKKKEENKKVEKVRRERKMKRKMRKRKMMIWISLETMMKKMLRPLRRLLKLPKPKRKQR